MTAPSPDSGAGRSDESPNPSGEAAVLDLEGVWKQELVLSGACLAATLLGWGFSQGPVSASAYLLAYLSGGWYAARESWARLRLRVVDVHFLMLAVAAGAGALGHWNEGGMLLFLFSFSGALERFALERTQREIRSLLHAAPKTAAVIGPTGAEQILPVDQLIAGMRVLVRPGELFAVDAEVSRGETAADESNLTGEAVPVAKQVGSVVLSGTLNLWGVVEATVIRPAQESALQKVVRLIQTAQRTKAPSQRFTDRFGTGYTICILGLTGVMFLVWWLLLGHAPFGAVEGVPSAFYHAMTLLVVASPCALVLSIPSAILAAIASGARHGILFRGGAAVEKLGEIQVVAMDKTGTLTTGELSVVDILSDPPGNEAEVLQLAYSLDRKSNHPLARAVTRHGKQAGLQPLELEHVESVTGSGMRAQLAGREVLLGQRRWVGGPPIAHTDNQTGDGVTEIWLRYGELTGRMILRDEIRPEAPALVAQLRRLGLRTMVLTGDRAKAAAHLREALSLDDVRGELSPEQKLEVIRSLSAEGSRVAMIGDGVNDAPSIAAAHVGVAMGARGSDAALEQADLVLMHDRLENFLAAYRLSRAARQVIRQNLAVSLGVILLLVGMAICERLPLTLGVLGHEGSTILVVLNSLRLIWMGSPSRSKPVQS